MDLKKYFEIKDKEGNVIGQKCLCVAIALRKGGNLKTANSLSLAWTFAQAGLKTLVIDMDPQASATQLLGVNETLEYKPNIEDEKRLRKESKNAKKILSDNEIYPIDDLFGFPTKAESTESEYHGLSDLIYQVVDIDEDDITMDDIHEAIVRPTFTQTTREFVKGEDGKLVAVDKVENVEYGFDLLPSSEELAEVELYLQFYKADQNARGKKAPIKSGYILSHIVNTIKLSKEYQVIVIDTPPSLGIMTMNAVAASDGTLISAKVDQQSILSLAKFKKNIRQIKEIEPNQKGIFGVLLGAVDKRSVIKPLIEVQCRNELGLYVFKNYIPNMIAGVKGNTLNKVSAQIDDTIAEAYRNVAEELCIRWLDAEAWEIKKNTMISGLMESAKSTPEYAEIKNKLYVQYRDTLLKNYPESQVDNVLELEANKIYRNQVLRKQYDQGLLWEQHTSENMVKELKKVKKENERQ